MFLKRRSRRQRRSKEDEEKHPMEDLAKPKKPKPVPVMSMFRYADPQARLWMVLAVFFSVLDGLTLPIRNYMIGLFINLFAVYEETRRNLESRFREDPASFDLAWGAEKESLRDQMGDLIIYTVALGVTAWIAAGIQNWLWIASGERQMKKIRGLFMESSLRQDGSWRDMHSMADLANELTTGTHALQAAMSEKLGFIVRTVVTFIAGLTFALVASWQLTLLILAVFPLPASALAFMWRSSALQHQRSAKAYSRAGQIASEVLHSVKTVMAFNTQQNEIERYKSHLGEARVAQERNASINGLGWGMFNGLTFLAFAISFWVGGILVNDGKVQAGDVLNVFIQIGVGVTSLGNLGSYVTTINQGRTAAGPIFKVIERESQIDPLDPTGLKLVDVSGRIEFKNVFFRYPSRPDVQVLEDVTISIKPGQRVGFVARSGSGKSTLFQLLMRIYDPQFGQVLLDGVDVKEYNVFALRQTVTIVDQEPTLFEGTIFENIALGADEPSRVTMDEVRKAATMAFAHDFIMRLPDQYETRIEVNGGVGLSGGETQRVSLARALVRNPKVLLLDEATSALDTITEARVLQNLNNGDASRTVLMIAHRLSTIRDCDNIVVLDDGRVIEEGSHDELIKAEGRYHSYVHAQELSDDGSPIHGSQGHVGTKHSSRQNSIASMPLSSLPFCSLSRNSLPRAVSGTPALQSRRPMCQERSADHIQDGLPPRRASVNPQLVSLQNSYLPGLHDESAKVGIFGPTQFPSLGRLSKPSKSQIGHSGLQSGHGSAIDFGFGNGMEIGSSTSHLKGEDRNLSEKPETTPKRRFPWKRVIRMSRNEKWFLLLGLGGAMFDGMTFPLQGFILARIIDVYATQRAETEAVRQWSLMFVAGGIGVLIVQFVLHFGAGVSGARLTERLRGQLFSALIVKDVPFFDEEVHSPDRLSVQLASETTAVESVVGMFWAQMLKLVVNTLGGILISLITLWKLTLVMVACIPLLGLASLMQYRMYSGFTGAVKSVWDESSELAAQVFFRLRAVTLLSKEAIFLEKYQEGLERPYKSGLVRALYSALGSGSSEALIIIVFALGIWYGGTLLIEEEADLIQVLTVLVVITFSAVTAGQIASVTADVSKGRESLMDIFDLIDQKPQIDIEDNSGRSPDPQGHISYEDVHFSYPTRPNAPVLQGFTLDIPSKRSFALVGRSGCGKSTAVSLILRFYDPQRGTVSMDSTRLDKWKLSYLRKQLSIVGQDPVLFGRSIRENIKYGRMEASDADMIEAAKKANIHEFILSLPDGYNTQCGEKGTQLSGGQKQRIAIARACLMGPQVLLLDEATSALDTESEKVVSEALERASQDITTISIAHRLSSIYRSDQIIVVDNGRIYESGTHAELMKRDGLYRKMADEQSFSGS